MSPEEIFTAMDQTAEYVSLLTGTKKQLMEAGRSEPAAEQVVLEMLRTARATVA